MVCSYICNVKKYCAMRNKNYSRKSLWLNNASACCTKRSNRMNAFLLFLFVISLSSCSTTKEKLLVICEQGSFAAGGTVITNPGIFDPYKPSPEGQTFHG